MHMSEDGGQLQGLSCSKKGGSVTPDDISQDDALGNIEKLSKMIGMDETCVREMKTQVKNSQMSSMMAGSVNMGIPFGPKASFAVDTQVNKQQMDDEMKEKGCGQVHGNFTKMAEAVRNINCTLHSHSSDSHNTASSSASVTIEVEPPAGAWDRLLQYQEFVAGRITDLEDKERILKEACNESGLNGGTIENYELRCTSTALRAMIKEQEKTSEKMMNFGLIDISNSNIRAESNTKIKILNQSVMQSKETMALQMKDIVEASAAQVFEQEQAKGSASVDLKSMVTTEVEKKKDHINTSITESITNTSCHVKSDGSILIKSPMTIKLSGTTISANSVLDMVTSSMTTSAVELGRQVAMDLLTQTDTKTESKSKSTGTAEVFDTIGKNNVGIVQAQGERFVNTVKALNSGGYLEMIIMGIVLIVAARIVMKSSSAQGAMQQARETMKSSAAQGGMQRAQEYKEVKYKKLRIILTYVLKGILVLTLIRSMVRLFLKANPVYFIYKMMFLGGSVASYLKTLLWYIVEMAVLSGLLTLFCMKKGSPFAKTPGLMCLIEANYI